MENKTTVTCHGGGGGPFLLHLPEEVMIQILVRLRVQSLLRFKCVCKPWRALIQTSYFIHLHTTFNSSSSSSSKFGSFILNTEDHLSSKDGILMLSECEGPEYEGHDGDWYRCTDGSWHKLTTGDGDGDDGGDEDGSRHKFSTGDGGGGDWHWDNTNYGWYRCTDGKFISGYWHWDNTNCGWYWVSDGGGDWHWDNTNYGWYWVSHGGDWHWDNTNCGWYWGDWLWDDTSGSWYWVSDDQVGDYDQVEDEVFKVDDDDDQLLLKVDDLELPSSYKLTDGKVIAGSCNGLICLYDQKLRDVSLWNPATRQFRILPKSITIEIDVDDDDLLKSGWDLVSFGFDVKFKDYKVLLITTSYTCFCRVQVYSLSTDSWRLFEGGGINSQRAESHGLYMNGSCFFVASVYHPESNTRSRFINSFDFTTEIFTTMQLPDHDHRPHLFLHCLGGGEKMALFTTLRKTSSGEYDEEHYYDDDGYEDCDIWVLNEHGGCRGVNKESWTKLHSFQIENCIRSLPIGISNNGKFAFLETTEGGSYRRRIQLYNLDTKEVKLDIPFRASMSKVYVYKPSLVSIIGGNGCSSSIIPDVDKVIGGAM